MVLTLTLGWCPFVLSQTNYRAQPVRSTVGYDFCVSFMQNNNSNATDGDLRLQLLVSSLPVEGHPEVTENQVCIELCDGTKIDSIFPIGQTRTIFFDTETLKKIYWNQETDRLETILNKGFRVYSKNKVRMTVYAINQIGSETKFFRGDGSHILPRQALGHEYVVACNAEDEQATEFVIMSTCSGTTNVTITLPSGVKTSNGKIRLTVKFTKANQIYIVNSQPASPTGEDKTNMDLSGTTICSDQPVAVWSGNRAAIFPSGRAASNDHAVDQLLPINQWGTRFIVPLTSLNTLVNEVDIVTKETDEAGTDVTITTLKSSETKNLKSFEKWSRLITAPANSNLEDSTLVIEASQPVQVFLYTSSAAFNIHQEGSDFVFQGDPSMTMIPALESLTDSTIFSTYNFELSPKPIAHEMLVWAKSSTLGSLKLDGSVIPSSQFRSLPGSSFSDYRFARIGLEHGTHTLTAAEKGFSGYVYGLEEGQAYLYPVGYEFKTAEDSLFLADEDQQFEVHRSEYDPLYPDKGGWYLDREEEPSKAPVLDSIFICDSTTLHFPLHIHNQWDSLIWEFYLIDHTTMKPHDYTDPVSQLYDGVGPGTRKEGLLSDDKQFLEMQFVVPPEKNYTPNNRHPYQDFEVRAVLLRKPTICHGAYEEFISKWQKDTLNTIVRAYRSYNDTTWLMKCTSDEPFQFFEETNPNTGQKSVITFYCKPNSVPAGADPRFHIQLKMGENGDGNSAYYTRHYQSVYGCDSISVLKVHLCQASEKQDIKTNLCEQELATLNEQYGRFFSEDTPIDFARTLEESKNGRSAIWSLEPSGTWLFNGRSTLKTTTCNDVLESYRQEAAKYLGDARGQSVRDFRGCDSVLSVELHVIPMETTDYGQMTFCGPMYEWKDKDGNVLAPLPRENVGVEVPYTYDEYYTSPAEWTGCVKHRHLLRLAFIDPEKIYQEPVTLCENYGLWERTRRDTEGEHTFSFDPAGHAGETIFSEEWTFTNEANCEYKFQYLFTINEAPRHHDTIVYCYEEGVTSLNLEWEGHNSFWWNLKGQAPERGSMIITQYPSSPADKDYDTRLIYELCDTLTTPQGCNDIYNRVIVIMPPYNTVDSRPPMTPKEWFEWEGVVWAGEEADVSEPNAVRLVPNGSYPAGWDVTYDAQTGTYTLTSLTAKTQPLQGQRCDSIISMTVQVGKAFLDTVFTFTCADARTYNWAEHTDVEVLIPEVSEPTTYYYFDSLKTTSPVPGLDSVWVLALTIYPTYLFPYQAVTCQSTDGYRWMGHMGGKHDLWIEGNHLQEGEAIPINQSRTFQIEDRLLTQPKTYIHPRTGERSTVRCDSIEVLTLTVQPSYTETFNTVAFEKNVQSNDTIIFFTQPRILFVGKEFDAKANGTSMEELQEQFGTNNVIIFGTDKNEETFTYEQKLRSLAECDSTTFLHLTVTKTKINDLGVVPIGDNNTTWVFGSDEVDADGNPIHTQPLITGEYFHYYYDEEGNVTGQVPYTADKDPTVRSFHFEDTLKSAGGSDSIIRVTMMVYPTYRIVELIDTTCHNDPYEWHGYKHLNELQTDPYSMTVEVDDTLHVQRYISAGLFDSIRVLQLTILPGSTQYYDTHLCMNETMTWRNKEISYDSYAVIRTIIDSSSVSGFESCKTKFEMNITWDPTYGFTGSRDYDYWVDTDEVCQYEPYRWLDANGKEHTKNLRDGSGKRLRTIPTDKSGWITIYDSLKTTSCHCDSIHILRLYVRAGFRDEQDVKLCSSDAPWEWITGGQVQQRFDPSTMELGAYEYFIEGVSVHGCDSSYHLRLHVDSTHLDTTHVKMCAKDAHFKWHNTDFDDYFTAVLNSFEPIEVFYRYDTVTKISQCDSISVLHLIIGPGKDSIWTDTICTGEKYEFYGMTLDQSGTYTTTLTNPWGCDVERTVVLRVLEPTTFTVSQGDVCSIEKGRNETFELWYQYQGDMAPISYSIYYDKPALDAGFVDQINKPIPTPKSQQKEGVDQVLKVPAPVFLSRERYPRPDRYKAHISFSNGICTEANTMTYDIEIETNYPKWITEQRYGDVIAVLNDQFNGGYRWSDYQWYKGDELLEGETKAYLYVPTGLEVGAEYHVRLTREGETESFASCPITIIENPVQDDFAPKMGYLSVTPTCVPFSNPHTNILSRKNGTYRLTTTAGRFVKQGTFQADVTPIEIPASEGMYIIQLWSDDTPEEPYRAIKIIVSTKCDNCDSPF